MFDAQLLFPGSSPETGIKIFSPWFPRRGDSFIVTLEIAQVNVATIKVEVFTKNSEDSGDGANANAGVNITQNAVGRYSQEWQGGGGTTLAEMVRYRYTVTGSDITDWVLFRMLSPVWFDSVRM